MAIRIGSYWPGTRPAVTSRQALGAPVQLVTVQGATHDDMVLHLDTDDDQLTGPIVAFVNTLAP